MVHYSNSCSKKKIKGYGLEIDNAKFAECIASGVNVIQADLDDGLSQFADQSFDYVILSQTLQAVNRPNDLLKEIARVGKQGIIGFPNFGHWQCRIQLALGGHMPVSEYLPNEWYNTPNIHLCTVNDFEQLCANNKLDILSKNIVNHANKNTLGTRLLPNLFGQIALYQIKPK
jgi:methionine biosynthesis protein MetW